MKKVQRQKLLLREITRTPSAMYSGKCRILRDMPANIHGQERSIEKVFSDDYSFSIPLYQRPYSWADENTRELLVDLLTAMPAAGKEGTVDPYFLGCIVLIKGDGPDAEVIDGQQRLTTLTMLLAALRHTMTTKATADHITQYIYAPGNPLTGRPDRFRLTLRQQDADFFQNSVQKESGIESLVQTKNTPLPDSRSRLRTNTLLLVSELTNRTEDERQRLARFVINNCFIVVVSTPSFDSAYRIFSILNDRGLNLSASDILKADLIGLLIPAERGKYGREWEDLEETLGTDRFNQLFAHVRMIYRRTKLKNVLTEFRDQIIKKELPGADADAAQRSAATKSFLVQTLFPYGRAFKTLATASYESTSAPDRLNELFRWLMLVDNADWVAPAIAYYHKHKNDQHALERYFTDLERLTASFLIRRTNVNQRIERYARLLGAIENGDDLYISTSPLQLDAADTTEVVAALDEDIYNANVRARAYILLRLDRELSADPAYFNRDLNPTIEHVLPQNPKSGSKWCSLFSDAQRLKLTNKLGNLALLTRNKNSEASNYKFDKKRDTYFTGKKGVTNYALTVSVLAHQGDWTPAVVEERQKKFLATFTKLWRLD
jgi:hypothetical protein